MTERTEQRTPRVRTGSGFSSRSDRRHRALVGLELITGASALLCGALLALRPDGSVLGLPVRVLEGTPFIDWRQPGLLLAGFVGVGYLVAGTAQRFRLPRRRELSVLAGSGLVLFEAVEWGWLGFHPLQAVFMAVGVAVTVLASTADVAVNHDMPSGNES